MGSVEFTRVYEEHKDNVWKLVSRYASRRMDREDLFQEVFVNIHRALPKFRGEAEISTWIYRVTVNTSLNFLKKQKRYALLKDSLRALRIVHHEQESPDLALFKPLDKLNPRQRMILIMAEIEEIKLEEIAKLLAIPLGTVKSNLHRAKEIIKKELKDNG